MIGQLLTGRYLILEKLGAGGFSETYLARDKYLPHHPLCVVKRLKLPLGTSISYEMVQQWFELEAQLLEKLGQHHNQIPTLLAYCQEDEEVYLVQEYIEGEQLGDWLAHRHRLTAKGAIALLTELLPLLDYLQSHHVIHRDITPCNLIRRRRDGHIVLIDFGAAYVLPEGYLSQGSENDGISPLTVGTPGYMPDEQQQGMAHISSDLYALGMVVIHLLTGVHPSQFELDPISGERDWHRHLKQKSVAPKLIAVLDRMIQAQVRDRYQQAQDVLADLQAIPRPSRPRQFFAQSWQFIQAVRVPAMAVLVMGVLGQQLSQLAEPAIDLEPIVGKMSQLSQQLLHPSDLHLTQLKKVALPSDLDQMLIMPNNRVLVTVGKDYVLRFWSLPAGNLVAELPGHQTKVTALSASPDSQRLVSSGADGTIYLWDIQTKQVLQRFGGGKPPVTAIALSPDNQTVISGTQTGIIRCWDAQTGSLRQTLKLPNSSPITAITYGLTSKSLISASGDRQIQIWNLRTGQLQRTFAGHTDDIVSLQVINPHLLLSVGKDRGLIWDLHREALVLASPTQPTQALTTSLNQQQLMRVDRRGNLQVWAYRAGRFVPQTGGEIGQPLTVAVSPNQNYLVSWNADRQLNLWRISTQSPRSHQAMAPLLN